MQVGDLIQTIEEIEVAGSENGPSKGDVGMVLAVREQHAGMPRYEIYFPRSQKPFWLFEREFKVLL